MLSPDSSEAKDANADRLAQARRKFSKYQSKKNKARDTSQQASDGDSNGRRSLDTNVSNLNDTEEAKDLKQELGRALERIRQLEIETKHLRNENRELHQLMESEVFADPLTTFDGHLLGGALEAEERQIIDAARQQLETLRHRYHSNAPRKEDLCSGCIGELVEI